MSGRSPYSKSVLDSSDIAAESEPFFIPHVQYVYRYCIRDTGVNSLSNKVFYIHNTVHMKATNGTTTEVLQTKELLENLIVRAMGGKVVQEQHRAKYIICDDLAASPHLKPIKTGQILVKSRYIYARFFDKNTVSSQFDSRMKEATPCNTDRKYLYRVLIDNSRFQQSSVPFKVVDAIADDFSVKSQLFGPLEDVEGDIIRSGLTVYGLDSLAKRYIDSFLEQFVLSLYSERVFAQNDIPNQSVEATPLLLAIQVSSHLYDTIKCRQQRQMLEIVGDLMLSGATNVDSFTRYQSCAILMNGLQVQFAKLESADTGLELTLSYPLHLGHFEQSGDHDYPFQFSPNKSNISIALGIAKSLILAPNEHEQEDVVRGSFMYEAKQPSPAKGSPSAAIQFIHQLQERRSPSQSDKSPVRRSAMSPEQASERIFRTAFNRRFEYSLESSPKNQ